MNSESSTPNLREFLLARIAEDEALSRAAAGGDGSGAIWQWATTETLTPVPDNDLEEAQMYQKVSLRGSGDFSAIGVAEGVHPSAGEYIARYDPARILAECAAKRAIISDPLTGDGALHLLAAVYAGHTDHRPENLRDWPPASLSQM